MDYVLLYYTYYSPLTVTSYSTVVAAEVLHIASEASASCLFPSEAVDAFASLVAASLAVASYAAASCCKPSAAAVTLVAVAPMDSTYCWQVVVSGAEVPLVVQHPSA